MHLPFATVLAAGTFLVGVNGLPHPELESEPIIVPVGDGFEILDQPSSTTTWSSQKREAQDFGIGTPQGPTLGRPSSSITWGTVGERDAKPQCISFGSPPSWPTLGSPSSTTTWGSSEKRDAEAQGISLGSPQGSGPSLGGPSSTTTWGSGEKREADAQVFGFGPGDLPTLGNPSTTTTWGSSEKRNAYPQTLENPTSETSWDSSEPIENPDGPSLSQPDTTITWGTSDKREADSNDDVETLKVTGSKTTWSEREADPQISLGPASVTISWSGYDPTDEPEACSCVSGAVGTFCGYCHQIQGSFISWNAYRCGRSGSCKSLGFKDKCASTSNACPL